MSCLWLILEGIPITAWPTAACSLLFLVLLWGFWHSHRGIRCFYFDPQDFAHYENGAGRELPVAAATGTFDSLLRNYIDVIKLLTTVAAASIAFGGGQTPSKAILVGKILLAFAILYGIGFAALLQYFYDEYCQNVRAYSRFRYSLIEALGFSALLCFIGGYFAWAFKLG